MIHLPASVRVYLRRSACDMQKSFDGLHALVRNYLELDAFAGHVPLADSTEEHRREVTAQELGALLSGIDLSQAQRRKTVSARRGVKTCL